MIKWFFFLFFAYAIFADELEPVTVPEPLTIMHAVKSLEIEDPPPPPETEERIIGTLEGKVSYYSPTNSTFRKIYGNGTLYGLEASASPFQGFYVYASGNILSISGRSLGEKRKCTLLFIPIELGLKYLFELSHFFDLYFGGAMLPFYAKEKCDSPFVLRTNIHGGLGGAFKAGMVFSPKSGIFLDVFVNYYLAFAKFPNTSKSVGRSANFSGLSVGGAIGYQF